MRIPKHIAIIPDGNRRWAPQHQMEKKDGYQHGLNPGLEVLRKAKEYGVAEITYYGFTVDNCKRPKVQQNAFKKACVDAVRLIQKEGNVSLLVVSCELRLGMGFERDKKRGYGARERCNDSNTFEGYFQN